MQLDLNTSNAKNKRTATTANTTSDARFVCINLERAIERRELMTRHWIENLRYPLRFFSAIDRRDVELGQCSISYDAIGANNIMGRPLSSGEIACATSHALVIREELNLCGQGGVFIFEDDAIPLPGASQLLQRVQKAIQDMPTLEVITFHKPQGKYKIREKVPGILCLQTPSRGSQATWYSKAGLERASLYYKTIRFPSDWIYLPLSKEGILGMLDPALVGHALSETSYIGTEHRGTSTRLIP